MARTSSWIKEVPQTTTFADRMIPVLQEWADERGIAIRLIPHEDGSSVGFAFQHDEDEVRFMRAFIEFAKQVPVP